MAEKLFKDFAPSHGIPMQKDSAEGTKDFLQTLLYGASGGLSRYQKVGR